jgi:hypothetical protein
MRTNGAAVPKVVGISAHRRIRLISDVVDRKLAVFVRR